MNDRDPQDVPERTTDRPIELGTEPTLPLNTGSPEEPRPQSDGDFGEHPERPSNPTWEPSSTQAEEDDRRQLRVGYLVTGLVFLGISALWLAERLGAVAVADMNLLVPVLLVVVGAAGLLAGLVRAARRG